MAESIIRFLIPKLTTLLSQEYTLLEGLEREFQYIRDELGSMGAFLRIAEAKQDADILDDEQKEWYKQVREVAYDTEDVVDHFLLRFAPRGGAGFRDLVRHEYTSVKNLRARHQIASKIGDIKYRVEQISARHQRYQSMEGISVTSSNRISEHPIRGHALLLEEVDLVGIDQPKREIISLILTNESHRKAISVVGMGGLGKTTLVKRVFEDPDVKRAFSIHAWLTISESFIIRDALKNLVHQFFNEVKQQIPGKVESMDTDGLRAFVKDFLKDRKYIIVLDDLWKSDHWDSIKYVFSNDICGSRIIITTRIKDLATTCCHEFRGNVHMMQPLSTDASWKLFCKKTFGEEDSCPQHLMDISRNIMSKCDGLPLGIVAVGGLLALKDTSVPAEWEMVLRSLGGELEGNGKLVQVKKILLLSYNDLPYYLKYCLLYIGIFPEDEIVNAKLLARLWIAEGFVEVRPGMTTMEVAQSYLNELIGRSLIQVAFSESDGRVITCCVHDLTYEIILSKCKELNILAKASTPHTIFPKNVRRLVLDEPTFQQEHGQLLHIRSLIGSKKCPSNLSDSSLSRLLKGTSKLLKVLHMESSHINIIPKEVFKLSYLTYLNLESTNVTNIPTSIKNLQNLEYLNLLKTRVTELPSDIIMLKKLSFLMASGAVELDFRSPGFKSPHGLGSLISLHYLGYIEADGVEIIREIGKLTQLRSLWITNVTREDGKELCTSLEKLTNLQLLNIESITRNEILDLEYSFYSNHQFLKELCLSGGLVDIPPWVPSCHALTKLFLVNSCLREDQLRLLEGLPNLTILFLHTAYSGDTLNFKAKGFQKLKKLKLFCLSGLKLVTLEKGALPYLNTLWFDRCTLLEVLPQDIQYLSNLRKLYLDRMPERLINNLRSIGKESDEYKKIAHITDIRIGSYINRKWENEYLKWQDRPINKACEAAILSPLLQQGHLIKGSLVLLTGNLVIICPILVIICLILAIIYVHI